MGFYHLKNVARVFPFLSYANTETTVTTFFYQLLYELLWCPDFVASKEKHFRFYISYRPLFLMKTRRWEYMGNVPTLLEMCQHWF